MKKISLIFLLVMILTSCITIRYGNISSSSIDLSKDYQVYDIANGISKSTSLLGIGEHKRDSMILDAKKNLYLNYPLKSGYSYANFIVDFKTSFFWLFRTTKVTVSADIVGKRNDSIDFIKNHFLFLQDVKILNNIAIGDTFTISEEGINTICRIIKISNDGKIIVSYYNNKGSFKTKSFIYTDFVFKKVIYKNNLYKNSDINKSIVISDTVFFIPKNAKGKIVEFKYNNKLFKGELVEEAYGGYLIRCETLNGENKGLIISKEDLVVE